MFCTTDFWLMKLHNLCIASEICAGKTIRLIMKYQTLSCTYWMQLISWPMWFNYFVWIHSFYHENLFTFPDINPFVSNVLIWKPSCPKSYCCEIWSIYWYWILKGTVRPGSFDFLFIVLPPLDTGQIGWIFKIE